MLKIARGELAVALGVLALAALVGWRTAAIPFSPLYSQVGPTVIPWIVTAGLAVLGALLLVKALTGGWVHESEDAEPPVNRVAMAWLALGLFLNVALIGTLGFIIASTLMFVCVARAFGSLAWPRDAGIALVLCLAAYLGFSRLLGISIGAGILEGIL